ncbi:hypothetical protein GBA52_006495 [Prunus armeniaca]|nr:hypothetical protein GBA52_006495 [Prunus armeniaca]
MKGGRKNLKRAVEEESLTLKDGHSIMQVLSLRGSNLIEIMDGQGEKSLALFPAKFQKSMWIKRGLLLTPEIFKSTVSDGCNASLQGDTSQQEENELDSSDDDGLPPLEANTNRMKPVDWKSDTESNSDSDTDS